MMPRKTFSIVEANLHGPALDNEFTALGLAQDFIVGELNTGMCDNETFVIYRDDEIAEIWHGDTCFRPVSQVT